MKKITTEAERHYVNLDAKASLFFIKQIYIKKGHRT